MDDQERAITLMIWVGVVASIMIGFSLFPPEPERVRKKPGAFKLVLGTGILLLVTGESVGATMLATPAISEFVRHVVAPSVFVIGMFTLIFLYLSRWGKDDDWTDTW